MNTKKTGILGEKIAEKYLKNKGYKILDKNYSIDFDSGLKRGEIDLIAKEKDIVIFVEVKSTLAEKRRGLSSSFFPGDKVDFGKQKKIIKTAQVWLMKNKIPLDSKWQIDIIVVRISANKSSAKIRHFKNAVFN